MEHGKHDWFDSQLAGKWHNRLILGDLGAYVQLSKFKLLSQSIEKLLKEL